MEVTLRDLCIHVQYSKTPGSLRSMSLCSVEFRDATVFERFLFDSLLPCIDVC